MTMTKKVAVINDLSGLGRCSLTAAAPGASLISLTMLIPALGLPLDAIAILGGLEYLVASTRTTLNVVGDALCALIVAKSQDGIDYDVFNGSDADAKQLDGEVA